MTIELMYLTWVTILTGLMWTPYILDSMMVRGLMDTMGYPVDPKPLSSWAQRIKSAHGNAVENLVVFAPLVLVVHLTGVSGETSAMACAVYFWARVVHCVAYTCKIPLTRTPAFLVGVACQMTLAWLILV